MPKPCKSELRCAFSSLIAISLPNIHSLPKFLMAILYYQHSLSYTAVFIASSTASWFDLQQRGIKALSDSCSICQHHLPQSVINSNQLLARAFALQLHLRSRCKDPMVSNINAWQGIAQHHHRQSSTLPLIDMPIPPSSMRRFSLHNMAHKWTFKVALYCLPGSLKSWLTLTEIITMFILFW